MRIYRARKDLFFREISATIMVGSMKRKKIRKPCALDTERMTAEISDDYTACGIKPTASVIMYPSFNLRAKDCRRLARWLDRAAEYLEYRSAKDGEG